MSVNHYIARVSTPYGEREEDFFLDSPLSVVREVTHRGWSLVSLRRPKAAWWRPIRFDTLYQVMFLQSMMFYLESGHNIGSALSATIESEADAQRRARMVGAREILFRGGTFAEAIDQLDWLDPIAAQILSGAEIGGGMDAIKAAIDHLEGKSAGWKQFWPVISMLLFDFAMIPPLLLSIHTEVIPFFEGQFKTAKSAATDAAMAQLRLIEAFNLTVLALSSAVLAVAILVFGAYLFSARGRNAVNDMAARMPLLRSYLLAASSGSSFGAVANMLRGGMPLYKSAELAARMKGFAGVSRYWETIATTLRDGGMFIDALRNTPLVRETEARLLATAPSEKHIAVIFQKLALYRQEEARNASRRVWKLVMNAMVGHVIITIGIGFWLYLLLSSTVDLNIASFGGGL
jgi:type II secretory pathway component PulF